MDSPSELTDPICIVLDSLEPLLRTWQGGDCPIFIYSSKGKGNKSIERIHVNLSWSRNQTLEFRANRVYSLTVPGNLRVSGSRRDNPLYLVAKGLINIWQETGHGEIVIRPRSDGRHRYGKTQFIVGVCITYLCDYSLDPDAV